jgi:hypothetical protein
VPARAERGWGSRAPVPHDKRAPSWKARREGSLLPHPCSNSRRTLLARFWGFVDLSKSVMSAMEVDGDGAPAEVAEAEADAGGAGGSTQLAASGGAAVGESSAVAAESGGTAAAAAAEAAAEAAGEAGEAGEGGSGEAGQGAEEQNAPESDAPASSDDPKQESSKPGGGSHKAQVSAVAAWFPDRRRSGTRISHLCGAVSLSRLRSYGQFTPSAVQRKKGVHAGNRRIVERVS